MSDAPLRNYSTLLSEEPCLSLTLLRISFFTADITFSRLKGLVSSICSALGNGHDPHDKRGIIISFHCISICITKSVPPNYNTDERTCCSKDCVIRTCKSREPEQKNCSTVLERRMYVVKPKWAARAARPLQSREQREALLIMI